jgi:NitT/TauT family transport system permease protein
VNARRAEAGRGAVAAGSVGLVAAIVVAWAVVSRLTFVIPDPVDTARVIMRQWSDAGYRGDVAVTFGRILVGLVIGVALGVLGGFALGVSATARAALQSVVMALYAIPKILLYPIVIPALTIGSASKVFMAMISVVFPVVVMVCAGIVTVPPIYSRLARSLELGPWGYLTRILVPATTRVIVTAVRVASSFAVLGVVLAEFFAADRGLGRRLSQSYNVGNYEQVFAAVLTLLAVTFAVSLGLWMLERRLDDR